MQPFKMHIRVGLSVTNGTSVMTGIGIVNLIYARQLMQKLMNAVGEMSVTFHRAFDMCSNPKEALEHSIKA